MNLFRYAGFLAEQDGCSEIELVHLNLAYRDRLQKHLEKRDNPFLYDHSKVFVEDLKGGYSYA